MLDGMDPRLQRGHHARLAVTVGGDDPVAHRGDLVDRPHLRHRELLVDRVVDLAQHTTGRVDLDQFGIAPELLTCRPDALVDTIGQAQLAAGVREVSHPLQRIAVQVAMPARG